MTRTASTDYWVPNTKEELVNWFAQYYTNGKRTVFEHMNKDRLYAIYFSLRNKRG